MIVRGAAVGVQQRAKDVAFGESGVDRLEV